MKTIYTLTLQADDYFEQTAELLATFKSKPSPSRVIDICRMHLHMSLDASGEAFTAAGKCEVNDDKFVFEGVYSEPGCIEVTDDRYTVLLELSAMYD